MPLYDFQCKDCGFIFESLASSRERVKACVNCHSPFAARIISCSGGLNWRPDAPWLETVREVVDKESTKPETRAFLESPTRENYKKWMKAEGIRPLEEGEKRPRVDEEKVISDTAERIMRRKKEREAITL